MALFPVARPESAARGAARRAEPWIEHLARLGYAAKGLVYLVVGGLALQTALGTGGGTTGSEGALQTILRQPFGVALLAAVALGLAGYALWRFVQAGTDPEGIGGDARGIAKRIAYGISGLIHAGLALEAARMATGAGRGGDGGGNEEARHWTAMVLEQPFGRWLVALVGLGIAAFGLYELVRAYRTELTDRLDLSRLGPTARSWAIRFGRMGLAARGVVFGVIGTFLIQAAWQYDSSEARGLGGALASLREQAYGRWLLGVVAAGLIAYGLFEALKARYRRIDAA